MMIYSLLRVTVALTAFSLCACAGLTEIEPYREVACIETVRVSLAGAVQAAEVEGGKAIDAAYRQPHEMGCIIGEPGYYDVTVLIGAQLSLVSVDAGSGQVEQRLQQNMFESLGAQSLELAAEGSSSSRIPIARKNSVTLREAIGIAERQGGKALEARTDMQGGRPGYRVKLVDRGQLHLAWVDGVRPS